MSSAPTPPYPLLIFPPPPPSDQLEIVVLLVVAFAAIALFVCGVLIGRREDRRRAEAAAAAAAPLPRAWPRELPQMEPSRQFEELRLRQARAANPAVRLPSFKYNQMVKHNVMGGGEEAATCSVCLGAFQLGETVRLLPAVCLHLYHMECIDPWLGAHSTCPICRSDTDPTTHVAQIPPV